MVSVVFALSATGLWTMTGKILSNNFPDLNAKIVQPMRDDITLSSLIGWAHTQNDPCNIITNRPFQTYAEEKQLCK